jgi:hypothetical protein
MMRAVLGETQFAALIERRMVIVQIPGGLNLELVLGDIRPERLLELHLEAMERPVDPPQAREFLPARANGRRQRK